MSRFDRYLDPEERAATNRFSRYAREPERMNQLQAFGSGAADAVTFGFGDEIVGALFGGTARDASRARQETARAERPGSFLLGQVGGSLAGGGGVGLAARGAMGAARLAGAARSVGALGRIGIGAGVGAAGGALYGAGDAPDEMRLQGAANNFIPGAVFGAGGQGLAEVGGRVAGAIGRSLSPEARAGRMMAESLERFGPRSATPQAAERDVLQALQNAPDNAMVADVVPGFAQLVKGAGVRPSREREALREAFDNRNNNMGEWARTRLAQDLGAEDVSQSIPRIQAQQRSQAGPLYQQAYNQRVAPSARARQMLDVDRRLSGNSQIFTQAAQRARDDFILETGMQNPTREVMEASPRYWHRLLEASEAKLGNMIDAARTGAAGSLRGSSVARETIRVRRLNEEIRRMLGPEFRQAQDIYAGAERSMRAQQLGYEAVQPQINSLRLVEIEREMRRMSPGEMQNFRASVAGKLQDMLLNADKGTGRSDVLAVLQRSAGQRRLLDRLFGAGALDRFMGQLGRQRELFRTSVESGIGVNSHTAPLLAAMNSQQTLTAPATGMRDALIRMMTRDMSDRFDEGVSNSILETGGINANQAAGEIASVGGFKNWSGGRGLLSRAVAERRRMLEQRPLALTGAFSTGLYAPTAGGGLGEYGGLW